MIFFTQLPSDNYKLPPFVTHKLIAKKSGEKNTQKAQVDPADDVFMTNGKSEFPTSD